MELFRVVIGEIAWSFREGGECVVFYTSSKLPLSSYSKRWRIHEGRLQFVSHLGDDPYWKDYGEGFQLALAQHLSRLITEET